MAESNATKSIYKKPPQWPAETSHSDSEGLPNEKAMEMSSSLEEMKSKAEEVYRGDEACQEKSKSLLREMGLPSGLFPLKDMEEFGIVRETGFVWFKQKQSITHRFLKIGKLVSYSTEVTAYMEKNRIKKLTGVKSKELSVWIKLSDIFVSDPNDQKITFQIQSGLSRSYPTLPFEDESTVKQAIEDKESKEIKEETKKVKEVLELSFFEFIFASAACLESF